MTVAIYGAWICLLSPLAAAGLITLAGGRISRRGAGYLATLACFVAFGGALATFVSLLGRGGGQRSVVSTAWTWISGGSYRSGFEVLIDPLSVFMMLIVAGVGALIVAYSIGYMDGDDEERRYFAYMALFVFSMLLLVQGGNLLILLAGWGMVGLSSYLLIGFWHERPSAIAAAKKAFIMNAIGDATMALALFLLIKKAGSVEFGILGGQYSSTVATLVALGLLGGAVAKSAQLPLQTWLPDAMEGPTPVSALIHAATMVTAGVYLVVRTHIFFEISGVALTVVLVVGLVTALYAALSALGQDDYKRVLAYSTMSQIGYMFFAAGLHAYAIAILLLVMHAFYKALLFMSAGNVMHALDGETDLKRMGGLMVPLSATFGMFVVGWLAIAGIPPLSGFFAKDAILAAASHGGRTLAFAVGLFAAFFSALYISRIALLAYFGRFRSERQVHEAPNVMLVPMGALAFAALVGGVLGISSVNGILPKFLAPVTGRLAEGHHGFSTLMLAILSVGVALAGIAVGWFVYRSGPIDW